jgi:hypothetical protein
VSWRTKAGELRPKGRELDASIQPVSAKVDSRKLGEDKARFPRMSLLGFSVNRANDRIPSSASNYNIIRLGGRVATEFA